MAAEPAALASPVEPSTPASPAEPAFVAPSVESARLVLSTEPEATPAVPWNEMPFHAGPAPLPHDPAALVSTDAPAMAMETHAPVELAPGPSHRQAQVALARVGEELVAWFKTLASAAVYATLIVTFGFQVARVEGQSMAPTLADQDRLIVNKLIYRLGEPRRGDIVMLYYPIDPDKSFVKRVIAEIGSDRMVCEALSADDQLKYLRTFGPDISLGHVDPRTVVQLEAQRRRLGYETFWSAVWGRPHWS